MAKNGSQSNRNLQAYEFYNSIFGRKIGFCSPECLLSPLNLLSVGSREISCRIKGSCSGTNVSPTLMSLAHLTKNRSVENILGIPKKLAYLRSKCLQVHTLISMKIDRHTISLGTVHFCTHFLPFCNSRGKNRRKFLACVGDE
jgi:hypothetical protein